MMAQRALGLAGGAAGIVQRGDVVRAGEAAWRGGPGGLDRLQQIDAVTGRTQGENGSDAGCPCRQLAAAIPERVGIDHQQLRLGILELEQLIVQRTQRMQPGDGEPRQLRGDAGAPAIGAVGGQERNPRPRRQAVRHQRVLHAADQLGRALVGDRAARPGERDP